MTYKKSHKNHKTCDAKHKFDDCKPNGLKTKGIISACGQGSSVAFLQNDPQTQVAFVTIDLSHLQKPKVLIEFSSAITYNVGSGLENQFMYELFRVCDNEESVLLGNWVFERREQENPNDASIETVAFNFNFCECIKCPCCCQYFVTVRPVQSITGFALVTINNARITAIAQSSSD